MSELAKPIVKGNFKNFLTNKIEYLKIFLDSEDITTMEKNDLEIRIDKLNGKINNI